MPLLSKCSIFAAPLLLLSSAALASSSRIAGPLVIAQADSPAEPEAAAPAKPVRPRKVVKPKSVKPSPVAAAPAAAPAPAPAPAPEPSVAPAPAPTPAPPAQAAAAAPAPPPFVSQKLLEAGAGCTGHVDAIARSALAGTKSFVPEASWRTGETAKHMVGVMIGQSFGENAKIPHALTGIVAAPGAAGARCDAYTFQVMPSPLSCKEIQAAIQKNGKPVADLAGLPLLRDASGQVVLLPGATGSGCVVVGFHTEY